MMLNAWLSPLQLGDWQSLHVLPLGELGGTLFGAGLLSTFFEYTFRRDQERAVTERFRQTIHEEAPALRDAVIEAFRFDRQDVARIATPELLDDLARTAWVCGCSAPASPRTRAKKPWSTLPASPPTPTKSSKRASPAPAPQ